MKILLLDKDGTLVAPASGAKFTNKPWDQVALPGVHEAIARFVADGYETVIISNQGGVEKGHKSIESAILEMKFALELFPAVAEAYFCPNFAGDVCWRVWGSCDAAHQVKYDEDWRVVKELGIAGQFRKPNPGMLKLAIAHNHATDAVMVGDRSEDREAAEAAGISFIDAEAWRGQSES